MTFVWIARLSYMNSRGQRVVRQDAADLGRRHEHVLGPRRGEELLDIRLAREIQLAAIAQDQVLKARRAQGAGRAPIPPCRGGRRQKCVDSRFIRDAGRS